jgi:hypothetical protein
MACSGTTSPLPCLYQSTAAPYSIIHLMDARSALYRPCSTQKISTNCGSNNSSLINVSFCLQSFTAVQSSSLPCLHSFTKSNLPCFHRFEIVESAIHVCLHTATRVQFPVYLASTISHSFSLPHYLFSMDSKYSSLCLHTVSTVSQWSTLLISLVSILQ